MLILAGTILVILGACCLAAGLYEDKKKDGDQPKEKDPEE